MFREIQLFDSATAAATSSTVNVGNAKKICLSVYASAITAGSIRFNVNVSVDGITATMYNKLIPNLNNAASAHLTRVGTIDIANTNAVEYVSIDPDDCFQYLSMTVAKSGTVTYHATLGVFE